MKRGLLKPRQVIPLRRNGSVLVPVVAAMLVLLICGVSLAEVFGSQRMRAVIGIESTQAQWTAEAGVWHASSLQQPVAKPVKFAGGTYTVEKTDDYYYSTSDWNQAKGATALTIGLSSDSDGGDEQSPLDENKSSQSAKRLGHNRIQLDLHNQSDADAVMESFLLSVQGSSQPLTRLTLTGKTLWQAKSGQALPTGKQSITCSSSSRSIPANKHRKAELHFAQRQADVDQFTLVLNFANGSSSTLAFTIDWSGKK